MRHGEKLVAELAVRVVGLARVLTIHNNPENLRLPARFQRLTFELADVDTQDISPFFAASYDFIEAARAAKEGARPYPKPWHVALWPVLLQCCYKSLGGREAQMQPCR